MKFLCDHMLIRLGKWLRAAGYDTLIANQYLSDHAILSIAKVEKRLIITRDRHFIKMKETASLLIYLKTNNFKDNIKEFNEIIKINWLFAPFSRCLLCNTPLELTQSVDLLAAAPPGVKEKTANFWYCQTCRHLYWEGSHTEHMLLELQHWQHQLFLKTK